MPAPSTIPVLERTLDLLSAIAASPPGLSAKELVLQLGIPSATCYRILRTLGQRGLLREEPDGRHRVGYGIVPLARAWSGLDERLAAVRPRLEELSRTTGLSGKISLREGADAIVVLRSEARRANAITSPVGARMALADAGSAGLMLLAGVPSAERPALLRKSDTRARAKILTQAAQAELRGMARSYGEHHPSIFAVSVPVDLGVPAAASLVGWPEDFSKGRHKEVEKALAAVFPPRPSSKSIRRSGKRAGRLRTKN